MVEVQCRCVRRVYIVYVYKNESRKCMYAHSFLSTAPNCIILFLCVYYYQDKVCLKKIKEPELLYNIFDVHMCVCVVYTAALAGSQHGLTKISFSVQKMYMGVLSTHIHILLAVTRTASSRYMNICMYMYLKLYYSPLAL